MIRAHCSIENITQKCQLIGVHESCTPVLWPADSQKYDIYINEQCMYELGFTSQQSKAKTFRAYCFNTLFPQIRDHFEQLAITEKDIQHRLAIEEKDNALDLLNDDLDESHRNIAILEQDNLELQRENEILKRRYVPYLEDPKKDNGIVVIQKNNGDEYPYIAICGQQGYVAQKIQNKLIDFPNSQIVVLAETGNSIVHYNFLRERGCIEVNPGRVRHFRLGRNLRHQDLLGIQDA